MADLFFFNPDSLDEVMSHVKVDTRARIQADKIRNELVHAGSNSNKLLYFEVVRLRVSELDNLMANWKRIKSGGVDSTSDAAMGNGPSKAQAFDRQQVVRNERLIGTIRF